MAKKASGGIKGKGKKNAAAMGRPSGGAGASGGSHGKLKKGSQFKSLKKQHAAVVTVDTKKSKTGKPQQHSGGKKSVYLSDEVRSFNERIAGQKKRGEARKQQVAAAKSLTLAPPTFVVAAPTFSFGAPPPPPVKEVEGFQGFLTTMTAPKDAPAPRPDPETRRVKPVQPAYQGSNVFAVLENDDGDEPQLTPQQRLQQQHAQQQQHLLAQQQELEQQRVAALAKAAQLPSPFMQPATFAFTSGPSAFTFQPPQSVTVAAPRPFVSSLQASIGRSSSSVHVIDPDL